MKYLVFIAAWLSVFPAFSQEKKDSCEDVVYLKGGSVLRGKIIEYKVAGDLIMRTWSGGHMQVPAINVKRMVQKCPEQKRQITPMAQRPYSFEERGWYHATRFSLLPGASGMGLGLQHITGIQYNRFAGVGIGVGVENFGPWGNEAVPTFPIFAEVRGYLLPKHITPFYALGFGYGISKKDLDNGWVDGPEEHWRGGWMAQGQIGYRIGNHAFVQFGVRLQQKKRIWENFFWARSSGVDHILHKRIDLGLGILL